MSLRRTLDHMGAIFPKASGCAQLTYCNTVVPCVMSLSAFSIASFMAYCMWTAVANQRCITSTMHLYAKDSSHFCRKFWALTTNSAKSQSKKWNSQIAAPLGTTLQSHFSPTWGAHWGRQWNILAQTCLDTSKPAFTLLSSFGSWRTIFIVLFPLVYGGTFKSHQRP